MGGTFFRSNLSLTNRGSEPAVVTLAFRKRNETTVAANATLTLAPGESRFYLDALKDLFALEGVAGQIAITTAMETPIVAWARTYNDQGARGTFGQLIPAFGPEDLIGPRGAVLPGLSEDARFRTNAGFVNVDASGTSVRVTAHSSEGEAKGSKTYPLAAGQAIFVQRIVTDLGVGELTDGYPLVEAEATRSVYAWASSVDNVSTDQTFVRPIARE